MTDNSALYDLVFFPKRKEALAATPTMVVGATPIIYSKTVTEVTQIKIPFIEHRIENPIQVITVTTDGMIVTGEVQIHPDTKSVLFTSQKPFSGLIKIFS